MVLEQDQTKINNMEKKIFYRVSNVDTEQGLWYDFEGNFTGLIHTEFDFCLNSELPMPFDEDVVGWLSTTDVFEDLFNWFSKEDIAKLECFGYKICAYESTEYRKYENHWLIKQDSAKLVTFLDDEGGAIIENEQKILFVEDPTEVNKYLNEWRVLSITAQSVSVSISKYYHDGSLKQNGKFAILLEKKLQKNLTI